LLRRRFSATRETGAAAPMRPSVLAFWRSECTVAQDACAPTRVTITTNTRTPSTAAMRPVRPPLLTVHLDRRAQLEGLGVACGRHATDHQAPHGGAPRRQRLQHTASKHCARCATATRRHNCRGDGRGERDDAGCAGCAAERASSVARRSGVWAVHWLGVLPVSSGRARPQAAGGHGGSATELEIAWRGGAQRYRGYRRLVLLLA
jgi:hypothetical protein